MGNLLTGCSNPPNTSSYPYSSVTVTYISHDVYCNIVCCQSNNPSTITLDLPVVAEVPEPPEVVQKYEE